MRWNRAVWAFVLVAAATWRMPAAAQFSTTAHSARSSAMGGVLLFDPGQRQATLSYRQDYLLPELADKGLLLVWPTARHGTAAAAYCHHGNPDYHEQQLHLGYALRATRWLHVGVAARYLHLGSSDGHYAARQWLAADVLLLATAGRNTELTLAAGSRLWDGQRPYRLLAQASYRPLPQLLAALGVESEERLRLRLGMEYAYGGQYFFRAGLATRPMVATFGLGLRTGHLAIDLSVEAHSLLGLSPQTSLGLCF